MTREERTTAIQYFKNLKLLQDENYGKFLQDACDIAVKAIEQESRSECQHDHETVPEFANRCRECGREKVLDKIRAEIESIERYGTNNGHDIWLRAPEEIKKEVLTIIDKYKAESEGK